MLYYQKFSGQWLRKKFSENFGNGIVENCLSFMFFGNLSGNELELMVSHLKKILMYKIDKDCPIWG